MALDYPIAIDDKSTPMEDPDFRRMLGALGGVAAVGVLAIAAYAVAVGDRWRILAIVGVAVAAAVSASMVGLFVGFLFGVPRSLQERNTNGAAAEGRDGGAGTAVASGSPRPDGAGYIANTNLEQISDWLTKILVGVGLTQLAKIPAKLAQVGTFIGGGLTADPGAEPNRAAVAAGVTILLGFGFVGFFVGYLVARLVLPRSFRNADGRNLDRVVQRLNSEALGAPPPDTKGSSGGDDRGGDGHPGTGVHLSPDAEADADWLRRKLNVKDVKTPEQAAALAKAQLAAGNFEAAAAALERAPLKDANNPAFRAVHELSRRIIEGVVYNALYEPPPAGFQTAIEKGEAYLSSPSAKPSATLYAYLTCAYGQKHGWLKDEPGKEDEAKAARAKALEMLKLTLRHDPTWRDTLYRAWDASEGGGPDNDLTSLYPDPEFAALLKPKAESKK